jgi:hypothetical protein
MPGLGDPDEAAEPVEDSGIKLGKLCISG